MHKFNNFEEILTRNNELTLDLFAEKFNDKEIIIEDLNLVKFKFFIKLTKNKNFKFKFFCLYKEDNSIPLLEHIEPDGAVCYSTFGREVTNFEELKDAFEKSTTVFTNSLNNINYLNIISEMHLYLNYKNIDNNFETKKGNFILINEKNLNLESNIIKNNLDMIFINIKRSIIDLLPFEKNVITNNLGNYKKIIDIKIINIQNNNEFKSRYLYDYIDENWNKRGLYILRFTFQENYKSFIFACDKEKNISLCEAEQIYEPFEKLGSNDNWSKCHFIIIGLGSIGSYYVELLSSLNPGFISLIDDDCLKIKNISRHANSQIIYKDKQFENKIKLIEKRINNKFQYNKINLYSLKINNSENINKLEELFNKSSKDIKNIVIINTTGELKLTTDLYHYMHKVSKLSRFNFFLQSLFIDKLLDQTQAFSNVLNFDSIESKSKFANFILEKWRKTEGITSTNSMCGRQEVYSLPLIYKICFEAFEEIKIECIENYEI